jgi:hypothetical protein
VSVKSKHHQEFTIATFVRLIIFAIVIFFLINYFSGSSNQSVLGDSTINLSPYTEQITNLLPEKSRQALQNLPTSSVVTYIQQQSAGFPQKQIKEIKKAVIKDIYDKILKSIDTQ